MAGFFPGLLGGAFSENPDTDQAARMAAMATFLSMMAGRGGNFGQQLGQAGMQGLGAFSGAIAQQQAMRDAEQQRAYRGMQMESMRAGMDKDRRAAERERKIEEMGQRHYRPEGAAPEDGVGPTQAGGFNWKAYAGELASVDPARALAIAKQFETNPDITYQDVGDAIVGFDKRTGQPVVTMPKGVSPDTRAREEGASNRADVDRMTRWDMHNTPSGNARLSEEGANRRHSTPSGSTVYAQGQENRRFDAMPVEVGDGSGGARMVPRAQAAGQPGKPASARAEPSDRDFDNARQTYATMYGSAMYGMRPGAPNFDQWLQTDWPKIRAAGGVAPPGSPTRAEQVPMGPAPAPPQRGVSETVPPPNERVAGAKYPTPRGMMIWTGTGWLPAN